MVVQGIKYNGIYFTYDFPQVVITDFNGYLKVKIEINEEVVYNEKMASKKVVINDLGNLLASYTCKPTLASGGLYQILPIKCKITFTDKAATEILPIQIFYSRVKLTPPERINTFISRYKCINTCKYSNEYITFLYTGNTALKIALEYKSDKISSSASKTILYGQIDINTLLTQLVSVQSIAHRFGVDVNDIIAYDISLINSDTVTDKIRYVVDNAHYYCNMSVTYANAVGAWETFAFTGSNVLDPEFTTQICHVLTGAKQTSSKFKKYQSVNTGFLSKSKRLALEDLIISDEIYVEVNGSRKKIIIEEAEMKYTEHNGEANSATVKFYPAESHDRELVRDIVVLKDIFDDTFDVTFN